MFGFEKAEFSMVTNGAIPGATGVSNVTTGELVVPVGLIATTFT